MELSAVAERTIDELEGKAIHDLTIALREPLEVAYQVLNAISRLCALETPGTLTKAQIVRMLLLQRLQNDLRCCCLDAVRGYPLQAATHAASVYEGWVNIASIVDEPTALRWLNHKSEAASFGSVRGLTEEALETVLGNREKAIRLYAQYQQLCMPKHLNPIVERARGYRIE